MKKITPYVILVSLVFLTTACNIPTPTATQAPTQPPATQAPSQPAATQAPTSQSSSPTSASAGTEVNITLADNTIQSSLTTFQVGVPYTFVIKNTGRHAHDFNISTPVSIVGDLDAALSTALLVVPQEQLGI